MEVIKRNQVDILELKTAMIEMNSLNQSSMDRTNSRTGRIKDIRNNQ